MSEDDITALLAIVGVGIGWCLSQALDYWLFRRRMARWDREYKEGKHR